MFLLDTQIYEKTRSARKNNAAKEIQFTTQEEVKLTVDTDGAA